MEIDLVQFFQFFSLVEAAIPVPTRFLPVLRRHRRGGSGRGTSRPRTLGRSPVRPRPRRGTVAVLRRRREGGRSVDVGDLPSLSVPIGSESGRSRRIETTVEAYRRGGGFGRGIPQGERAERGGAGGAEERVRAAVLGGRGEGQREGERDRERGSGDRGRDVRSSEVAMMG